MVRIVIAIIAVTVVFPSTVATAQTKSSGARPPQVSRGQAPAKAQSKTPATTARPVSRTQDAAEPKPSSDGPQTVDAGATVDTGAAVIQLKNDVLNQQAPEMSPALVKELDRILEFWSASSEDITRLQGKHFRIVYDTAFEVEKQSEGEFAYEKADKGRLDITPVDVTPELVAARDQEVAKAKAEGRKPSVRVGKNGKQFTLVMEQQERWSCDGQRVYSMDIEKKEAIVAQLPADMQGKNIMDSPLPFLFGMPPEKAKHRFTIFFTNGQFDPKSGRAKLTIYPRLPQDATNWRQADVILDLKEFLPTAVQLLDPAGTKITVYRFKDFKKNEKDWVGNWINADAKTRFTPDLRDFQVQVVGEERPGEMAENAAKPPIGDGSAALVNVSGLNHNDAVKQLQRQGLQRVKGNPAANQIVLEQGPPAKNPDEVFTVKSQDPAPGTPVKPGMKVKLTIYTDPNAAQKQ
jgi:hypothetical protein